MKTSSLRFGEQLAEVLQVRHHPAGTMSHFRAASSRFRNRIVSDRLATSGRGTNAGCSSSSNDGPAVRPCRPDGIATSSSPSGRMTPVIMSMAVFMNLDRRRLASGSPKCCAISWSTRK